MGRGSTASAYSCTQLSASGSSGMGENNDGFWITETQSEEGVVIEWGEADTKLGQRQFPVEFFEAHSMERFVIEAPNGDQFSYMVWGAQSCTPCPEQTYTPLPGDPSDCANANDACSCRSNRPSCSCVARNDCCTPPSPIDTLSGSVLM